LNVQRSKLCPCRGGITNRWRRAVPLILLALALSLPLFFSGCEGTQTRNQADDTVEELAGKKQVERMRETKDDLERIQAEQAKRIDQIEDSQ
jgi:hypothetical protein